MKEPNILRNNFLILLIYTTLISYYNSIYSDYGMLHNLDDLMGVCFIHALVNFFIGFRQLKYKKGGKYFLSGLLIIVIGVSACFAPIVMMK